MSVRERDPDFIRFARRAGIVAGAAASVMLFSKLVLSAATRDVRELLSQESRERVRADSLMAVERISTDRRLDRLASITELVVLAVAEQTDAAQRREALQQLRRMRRVAP